MTDKPVLRGSLEFIGLAELLQQLGGNASSGVLKLVSDYAEYPGYIYLKGGDPVDAEFGTETGLKAFNEFFGWKQAEFEFINEEVACERVIKKSRMELILDGLRMIDEGQIPTRGPDESGQKKSRSESAGLPLLKGPVVDYVYVVDEETFEDGREIVAQNRFGNWFWVILEGVAEVVRVMPEGRAPILRLSEGAYIGSIVSFLREGNVRSASVYAVGRVQLGVIESELIAREYSNLSELFQNILISIDKRMRQVTDVCAKLVLNRFEADGQSPPGKLFIGQGRNEDQVIRITSGQAVVCIKTDMGYVHLLTLVPGDILGRLPYLNTAHEPYSAEVYVSGEFNATRLDTGQVEREYEQLSGTFKNMIQNMTNGISVTTGRVFDLIRKAGKE
ncbi:MAG: cyclic nucleotide-binding domain-containing protein [Desulfobacteraceae bacterium]|nr:cyclic nucleotide-binding domain-containing protein [Desulfobacteraceae bacterium]MCF8094199.1 cyclic nucleotide-binding domain-containing protein [Desulfobacteraceae bacterium]